MLGLVGGLFGTLLTFAAALLKHSLDTRTLELSRETEGRLRLETSIQAVDLLSASDGSKSPPTKQAGALFALASLGQVDLALALLAQMWPLGDVSSEAAVWVIDRGLRSSDENLQSEAAWTYRMMSPEPR